MESKEYDPDIITGVRVKFEGGPMHCSQFRQNPTYPQYEREKCGSEGKFYEPKEQTR